MSEPSLLHPASNQIGPPDPPQLHLLEKLRRNAFVGGFIGDVLGAFFTKLKMRALAVRLRPGASGTIESALLIYLQQRARAAQRPHFFPGMLQGGRNRGKPTSYFADWFDLDRSAFLWRLRARLCWFLTCHLFRFSYGVIAKISRGISSPIHRASPKGY